MLTTCGIQSWLRWQGITGLLKCRAEKSMHGMTWSNNNGKKIQRIIQEDGVYERGTFAMITDLIDREIKIDDYVVFHNNIYKVLGLGKAYSNGGGQVRIMLAKPSKTTRPVVKHSKDLCLLAKEDILIWLLKGGG